MTKGDRVLVHGHLETETWTDRDTGEKRTREVINIDEVGLSLTWARAQRAQRVTNTRPEIHSEAHSEDHSGTGRRAERPGIPVVVVPAVGVRPPPVPRQEMMSMDEDEIPDQRAEAMFGMRNPVPPVAGVPHRDRGNLGPAGSLRQARVRHRQLTKPTTGTFIRSWRLLVPATMAATGLLLAALALVTGNGAATTTAGALAGVAVLTLAVTVWFTYRHDGQERVWLGTERAEKRLARRLGALSTLGWVLLVDRLLPGGEARVPLLLVGLGAILILTPIPDHGPTYVDTHGELRTGHRSLGEWLRTRAWQVDHLATQLPHPMDPEHT